MVELKEYLDSAGRSPFERWFRGLDSRAAVKVTSTLARLETGNFSEVKTAGGGVFERRIHYGPGYRVYFGRDGDELIILLGGGIKRGQNSDILKARACWQDYRRRKRRE